MEAILILGLFLSLAALSLRFGYDSRKAVHSKEHQLAVYGTSWQELTEVWDSEAVLSEVQALLAHGPTG